ncbi:PD-(D/E)XK nuclease family protein [Bifidobacterium callitrichidarum]|uniref:Uncharacterized protein n=1 Tax=Bifidobacterium callitrichidarum TaxID=2052941 RepID=A0A2U2N953_9BIFI|nr:PD-(D/E)XK nuclease family protein [Bifidobacterium callitrichidarum]PWG65638.1 hypothetical protein DF196_06815 [Bifidobacterium callitrichidarum]
MSEVVTRRQLKNQAQHSSKPIINHEDNVFSIIGMGHQEIKHSNYLAYLLNPHNNHGLRRGLLKKLYAFCLPGLKPSMDIKVYREKADIDLLIVDMGNKAVICIENKVFAKLSADQLDKYYDHLRAVYPTYRKAHVFLTPSGRKVEKKYTLRYKEWFPLSYTTMAQWMFDCAFTTKTLESKQPIIVPREDVPPLTAFMMRSWFQLLEQEQVCELPEMIVNATKSIVAFNDATAMTERIAELEAINSKLNRDLTDQRNYVVRLKNKGYGFQETELDKLRMKNTVLNARYEELRTAYTQLTEAIRTAAKN